ncbi:MAG: sialate O-acetylesterase [Phycisphaeraceae bacterium]
MTPKLLALCMMALCAAATLADEPTGAELWILSGQSNAGGKAPDEFAPPKSEKVQWYDLQQKQFSPVAGDLPGMTARYSPFHTAAAEVAQAGFTVKMMGYAKGGAPIRHWLEKDPKGDPTGLDKLHEVIGAAGKGADVFIWFHGGADRGMQPRKYKRLVSELIQDIRTAAGNPQMTVVIVQSGGRGRGMLQTGEIFAIREAQRQWVVEDGHAVLVPALGRATIDGGHLTAQSQAELGREIGRALLSFRHQKKDVNWPGPVLDKAGLGNDGRTVVVHFAEVEKLSGGNIEDFKVIDAAGEIRSTKVDLGKTVVTLTLERELKLPAEVGYGYDTNPPGLLRDEAGNHAPTALIKIDQKTTIVDEPTTMPNGAGKP